MGEVACDILVVGAGPAGLAAAVTAAERGAKVAIVDDNPHAGGQIWRASARGLAPAAREWVERARAADVTRLGGTTIVHAAGPHHLVAEGPEGVVRLRAERTVLATGARELFLPFPGWTRPGVCGAGGLQALVKSGWDVSGQRVVVAGSGPLLLAVAAFLREHDATVVALVEQASPAAIRRFAAGLWRHPRKGLQGWALRRKLRGIRYETGTWPVRVEGRDAVEAVVLGGQRARRVPCELVACGFGLVPEIGIASFLGCATEGGAVVVDARQETSVPGVFAAGEVTGVGGVDVALVEGRIAAFGALGEEAPRELERARRREHRFAVALDRAFRLRAELRDLPEPDTVVCRCEDVSWASVAGLTGAREAKLRTRCGMGPCQGRVCGPALRFLSRWEPDRVRPPFFPVSMAALADAGAADEPQDEP